MSDIDVNVNVKEFTKNVINYVRKEGFASMLKDIIETLQKHNNTGELVLIPDPDAPTFALDAIIYALLNGDLAGYNREAEKHNLELLDEETVTKWTGILPVLSNEELTEKLNAYRLFLNWFIKHKKKLNP